MWAGAAAAAAAAQKQRASALLVVACVFFWQRGVKRESINMVKDLNDRRLMLTVQRPTRPCSNPELHDRKVVPKAHRPNTSDWVPRLVAKSSERHQIKSRLLEEGLQGFLQAMVCNVAEECGAAAKRRLATACRRSIQRSDTEANRNLAASKCRKGSSDSEAWPLANKHICA